MSTKGQNSLAEGFLKNSKAFLKKDFLKTLKIPSEILILNTAKKKWLNVYKAVQISNILLVLRTKQPCRGLLEKFKGFLEERFLKDFKDTLRNSNIKYS